MRIIDFRLNLLLMFLFAALFCPTIQAQESYQQKVLKDAPAFYWSAEQAGKLESLNSIGTVPSVSAAITGGVSRKIPGPRSEEYPGFSDKNSAIQFTAPNQWLVVKDHGEKSPLKFQNGDALTIEAWVNPKAMSNVAFPYIVGKGRTSNPGFNPNNQNYALRLTNVGKTYAISFFFVDEEVLKGGSATTNGHRWTTTKSFPADGAWHHIALSYKFGEPESIQGYIDGKQTNGKWDLAGPTTKKPIVDNDELWIGAAMQGGNHFQGGMDELAIYRKIVPAKTLSARFKRNKVDYLQKLIDQTVKNAPTKNVLVDIHEGIADTRSWDFRPTGKETVYDTPAFALTKLPTKYNSRGIITDRKTPYLVHAYSTVKLPAGDHEFVLRSMNTARLYIDGKLQSETPFMELSGSAHGTMHKVQPPEKGELSMPIVHTEKRLTFQSDGKPHVFSLMTIVGEKSRPDFLGELVLACGKPGNTYQLLGHQPKWSFNTKGWTAFRTADEIHRTQWNNKHRIQVSLSEADYWKNRHQKAAKWVESQPKIAIPTVLNATSNHPIDLFIEAELQKKELKPTSKINDLAYLRRITLDLTGLNPTPEQIAVYLDDAKESRRKNVVDRLLKSSHWADHWVSYWQDILAENPGMTKPNLNNSGPFRWYLHDALTDNRSYDRMVSELILLDGSIHNGGTAGFGIAANNDAPMAAKAHILGTAFLGIEMKCARCHDAPYHQSLQRDLFEIAAMLDQKPLEVPLSSSISATPEQIAKMPVAVTVKPGEKIAPNWPFKELLSKQSVMEQGIVRNPDNTREMLGAFITHHANERFAKVIVNRFWKRLLGRGIVEPAEDWETGDASHPQLLDWLARDFVKQGYDLKKLTQLIVTSNLYQRQSVESHSNQQKYFAGPTRKRLTAEQIVDTVFQVVGKPLPSERLTYNSDGRQIWVNFIDLGQPRKSWELVAISNERERPSMALPKAQSVVDVLSAYGWRSERQDPVTDRELTPTPLQPLALANGSMLNRAVEISDQGGIVTLALEVNTVDELIDSLFLQILSRSPNDEEKKLYQALLSPGFEQRKTGAEKMLPKTIFRSPLTWSFHFDPVAAEEGIRQQALVEQGEIPTKRLNDQWRKQAEDALWALLNTPEFIFVP